MDNVASDDSAAVPRNVRRIWLPAIRAGSGSDVFVERLASALRSRGIDAVVSWFPHKYELFPGALRNIPVPEGVDVVHANAAQAFAFKRRGIPLVATELHYILDPEYRPYKSLLQHVYHRALIGRFLHRSYAAADAVTAISGFTAGVLETVAKVKVARTIPLWVDLEAFSPAPAPASQTERRPFRLLFVGNGSRRKGADVIPLLAKALGSDFEIVCTAGLRQQMHKHELVNVRILGRLSQPQLIAEYRNCDAVLVPSRYEGFGYAALEAMACAKPVVGFRCGAIAEVVEDGRTALLVDIDDVDGLLACCRRLASDPALCRMLGEAGRRRAEQSYSETAAVDAYVDLYAKLIGAST